MGGGSMRVMRWRAAGALAATVLTLGAHVARVEAWRHYMANIPNAGLVPCPPGMPDGGGCVGGFCEAFGHDRCSGNGEENEFGEYFEDEDEGSKGGGGAGWTVAFCAADTDGDGKTNGDELGDSCCTWAGAASDLLHWRTRSGVAQNISNPADASSRTNRPSCTLAGVPPTLNAPTAVAIASAGVELAWALPASACVCEVLLSWRVTGSTGAASTALVRGDESTAGICGLTPGTQYSFTVTPYNRAGGAASASAALDVTTAAAGTATTFACLPAAGPTSYRNTIPAGGYSVRPTISPRTPTLGIVAVIIPALALLGCGCIVHAFAGSLPVRCCTATCLTCIPCRPCLRAPCLRVPYMRDMAQVSPAFVGLVAIATAGLAGTWVVSSMWYAENMVYAPIQAAEPALRGAGYALAAALGLSIVPAARWSPLLAAIGASFERAIALHRWLASLAVVLTAVHGIGFAVAYAASPLGLSYLFVWSSDRSVNSLAGTLAGFAIAVMAALAWEPIRRRAYGIFLAAHMLWPAVLLLSFLHVRISETKALPLFLPGIVLMVFDHGAIMVDYCHRRTQLAGARVMGDAKSAVVRLDCIKADGDAAFAYEPGQYVYLWVPSISLIPHPFSLSSLPDAGRSGWFTIHARVAGSRGFVAKLVNAVGGPASAVPAELPGAGGGSSESRASAVSIATVVPDVPTVVSPLAARRGASNSAGSLPRPVSLPTVYVSGPYGTPTLRLADYSNFVLFAGGIGITPIAPLHAALANGTAVPSSGWCHRGGAEAHAPLRFLLTAWSVRERGLAAEFTPLLGAQFRGAGGDALVGALVYSGSGGGARSGLPSPASPGGDPTVGATAMPLPGSGAASPAGDAALVLRPGMTPVAGRLSVAAVLSAAATEVARRRGDAAGKERAASRVAVIVCGPQALVDDVYATVASYAAAGRGGLVWHVHKELFAF